MNKKHFYPIVILLLFLAVGIQPALAIDIPGDTSYYDIVDGTYVLNQNVYETIEIMFDGITLDGGGYTVSWASGLPYYGVDLLNRSGVTVKNLIVTGFSSGISLRSCSSGSCTVTGNTVSMCDYGIWLVDSSNVIVENNNVHSNLNDGISIVTAMGLGRYNILSNNTVSNNGYGITLGGNTDENEIYNNTVSNNGTGIYLCGNAQSNEIYNNNFENTTNASVAVIGDNMFGDESTGGNYWSDYAGDDDGSDGRIAGDGIGDTLLPHLGVDYYPFMFENGWLTPPTPQALIVQLIDTVEAMNLQQGIDNSLDAKLDAAFNALDDLNQNNDVAAINSLNAFINAVEAQRDKKITNEQADALIDAANYIITLLSG